MSIGYKELGEHLSVNHEVYVLEVNQLFNPSSAAGAFRRPPTTN